MTPRIPGRPPYFNGACLAHTLVMTVSPIEVACRKVTLLASFCVLQYVISGLAEAATSTNIVLFVITFS